MKTKKNLSKFALILFSIFIISACTNEVAQTEDEKEDIPAWMDYELEDVNTGEKFTINQLNDKKILLESFAVWCPVCTKQQNIIKELHEELGESFISISIDADPNEDKETIIAHTKDNDFNWRYAISPAELTQILIDEFGINIVSAPSVPIVLICEDNQFTLLSKRGVKDIDYLKKRVKPGVLNARYSPQNFRKFSLGPCNSFNCCMCSSSLSRFYRISIKSTKNRK